MFLWERGGGEWEDPAQMVASYRSRYKYLLTKINGEQFDEYQTNEYKPTNKPCHSQTLTHGFKYIDQGWPIQGELYWNTIQMGPYCI